LARIWACSASCPPFPAPHAGLRLAKSCWVPPAAPDRKPSDELGLCCCAPLLPPSSFSLLLSLLSDSLAPSDSLPIPRALAGRIRPAPPAGAVLARCELSAPPRAPLVLDIPSPEVGLDGGLADSGLLLAILLPPLHPPFAFSASERLCPTSPLVPTRRASADPRPENLLQKGYISYDSARRIMQLPPGDRNSREISPSALPPPSVQTLFNGRFAGSSLPQKFLGGLNLTTLTC